MKTKILLVGILLFTSQIAMSAIHFGLSGSMATNNLGLEVHRTQAGKASLAFDLGSHFRLSLSTQYRVEDEEGHKDIDEEEDEEELVEYEATTEQISHALDLIAVLYGGEVFTPFVFVGAAYKMYDIVFKQEGKEDKHYVGEYPAPNFGAGLGIALNKNFSLKLTNTWSMGQRTDPEDTDKVKQVRDVQSDIGITYRFD